MLRPKFLLWLSIKLSFSLFLKNWLVFLVYFHRWFPILLVLNIHASFNLDVYDRKEEENTAQSNSYRIIEGVMLDHIITNGKKF